MRWPVSDPYGAFLPGPRAVRAPTGPGPLDELSIAVKDLIDLCGARTDAGGPGWGSAPAAYDAPAVARLRAAGAAIAGKTVTDEVAFSLEGANPHYPPTINPSDPGALSGGSSSGSAVAVAAGLVDGALGTDTGGSVRVPAAFWGIFGFRPSHGAVSLAGVTPFAASFDTVGWLARDADTLARIGDVLLDAYAPEITDIRLAANTLALADADVAAAVRAHAAFMVTGPPVAVLPDDWRDLRRAYAALQAADIRAALAEALAHRSRLLSPVAAARFAEALHDDPEGVAEARAIRAAATARLDAILPPGRATIVPTAPVARLARDAAPSTLGAFYPRALALCAVAGRAGAPQGTMPLDRGAGLSLIARPGADRALLGLMTRLTKDAR